jgi:predicted DCC family thiol-disulfide oxidoreductase YuxK
MVILADGRYYLKSDAIARLAQGLRAPWSWYAATRILPRPLRDRAYDCLARNRYNIFGRYDSCMVPDATLRRRFPE